MNRWDGVVGVLPALCERLKSLQSLHNDAENVVGSLIKIEEGQKNLEKKIENNSELLQMV